MIQKYIQSNAIKPPSTVNVQALETGKDRSISKRESKLTEDKISEEMLKLFAGDGGTDTFESMHSSKMEQIRFFDHRIPFQRFFEKSTKS